MAQVHFLFCCVMQLKWLPFCCLCQMISVEVWQNTATSCHHQSTACPSWHLYVQLFWYLCTTPEEWRPGICHRNKLCQSCYYQLRQIRTVRHSLTSSAIQTLVHAFICTRVDFSNSLLYGTSAYLLDRLQSVLNSAARLILRIGKYDPISAAIRRDLHWLPVPFRIRYKLNSITSNCLAGRAPEYLIELCHSVTDIPARRNLRSSSQVQLLVPRYRKERSGKRGFSVSSPQLWNLLPADIRLLHNEHQLFRKRLKTHYMQQSMLCHWGSMSTVWTLLLLLLLLKSIQSHDSFETALHYINVNIFIAMHLIINYFLDPSQIHSWL